MSAFDPRRTLRGSNSDRGGFLTSSHSKILLLGAVLLLGGCCYFVPCHPAGYMVGTVEDGVSRQPISNASVRLYHYQAHTSQSGCFALGGADALPFEFGVTAPGYKPVLVEAVSGSHQAKVTLMPKSSTGHSASKLIEISRDRYAELSEDCRQSGESASGR